MISREELEAYDSAFQTLTDKAKATLKRDLASYISANEGATVEELREFAIQSLQSHIGVSNQQAATLAADWYDKLMKQDGLKLAPAELADAVPDEVITKAAHYQAGKLVEGDTEAFVDACTDLLEHSMKRALIDTVAKNVGRDKKRGIHFQRVPMGGETCAFCIMLASRGDVYHTRFTAGEMNHYHSHCRCKVVPVVDGKQGEYLEKIRLNCLAKYEVEKRINRNKNIPPSVRERMRVKAIKHIDDGKTVEVAAALGEAEEYDDIARKAWNIYKTDKTQQHFDETVNEALKEIGTWHNSVFSAEMNTRPDGNEIYATTRAVKEKAYFIFQTNKHKVPDVYIDGQLTEIKTLTSVGQTKKRIKHALGKFDNYPDEKKYFLINMMNDPGAARKAKAAGEDFIKDGTIDGCTVII